MDPLLVPRKFRTDPLVAETMKRVPVLGSWRRRRSIMARRPAAATFYIKLGDGGRTGNKKGWFLIWSDQNRPVSSVGVFVKPRCYHTVGEQITVVGTTIGIFNGTPIVVLHVNFGISAFIDLSDPDRFCSTEYVIFYSQDSPFSLLVLLVVYF